MNSFQADLREEMRPQLPRKNNRAQRHQRKPAKDERPPPEDEELLHILEDAADSEEAEFLRQKLDKLDANEEKKGDEESSEDQDIDRLLALLTEDYSLSYKDIKDHL